MSQSSHVGVYTLVRDVYGNTGQAKILRFRLFCCQIPALLLSLFESICDYKCILRLLGLELAFSGRVRACRLQGLSCTQQPQDLHDCMTDLGSICRFTKSGILLHDMANSYLSVLS